MQPVTKIYQERDFINKMNKARYSSSIFSKIVSFNDKVLEGFKLLEENEIEVNERYYDYIMELNELAGNNLHVNNYHDFNKAFAAIKSSEILVDRGIIDKDIECLSEGLFGLGFMLEDLGILG